MREGAQVTEKKGEGRERKGSIQTVQYNMLTKWMTYGALNVNMVNGSCLSVVFSNLSS